ncbi:uncharacterized protein B0H18DRAFT_1024749 [Fomitopsis serialis]|uniref:uncharacterized protein n=1 Tax=Fomitopsis serialis TaxID=139415 RepID=UPI002008D226|nr:uncharacterized protein B0H18DRAFT_1024749 [Neoantrodia serialis]KAH9920306.1 hypothetical protein B0H18DRAFT_1024749 [Neoantrodia serialis]
MFNKTEHSGGSVDEKETQYYKKKLIELAVNPEDRALSDEVQQYLAILTDIADALGVDDLSFSSYSAAMHTLSMEELTARRSTELVNHLASMRHEEALIQQGATSDASVPAMERRRAVLAAKIKEYRAEEETLKRELPAESVVTVTELAALHKQIKARDKTLAEKRAKVAAFQGLPPNIELARHELRKAQDEQMNLIQLRERLLDRMASGVS